MTICGAGPARPPRMIARVACKIAARAVQERSSATAVAASTAPRSRGLPCPLVALFANRVKEALTDAGYLKVEGKHRQDTNVLMISGALDSFAADRFEERAAKAVEYLPGPVLVDLTGLTFIDCRGIRALSAAIRAIPSGQPVAVECSPRSIVVKALRVLSVDLGHLRAEAE
jgi:anti-anti-sigma factor